ncbi:MAG: hypothetical protein GY950_11970 [bacterium]|nr:hypothetical protein [bacterium]
MKRKTSNNKLALGKETIASLDPLEMNDIHGGSVCGPTSICITFTLPAVTQKQTGQTCGA